jgi:hypothetical protein
MGIRGVDEEGGHGMGDECGCGYFAAFCLFGLSVCLRLGFWLLCTARFSFEIIADV